ncbi:hypothetical protein LZ31DRAFT_217248 [Colletotrichum somersetense]|nr:hypothetical protein LZ31DRAFT_217248 [Colletotrichum somersetense]
MQPLRLRMLATPLPGALGRTSCFAHHTRHYTDSDKTGCGHGLRRLPLGTECLVLPGQQDLGPGRLSSFVRMLVASGWCGRRARRNQAKTMG